MSTLNGSTLPGVVTVSTRTREPAGEYVEMASGKLTFRRANSTGYRNAWAVKVEGLTSAQRDTVMTAYDAAVVGEVTWVPEDGGSYTVVAYGTAKEELHVGGIYTVSFTLKEAL